MRSLFLSSCAAVLALTAIAAAPAMADPLHSGGVVVTRGGGNVNVAKGKFAEADQAITTLGGVASGRGRAITNGGNNRNIASGKFSFAGQDVTTVGGFASGRGRAITSGGYNTNKARGFGSTALQSVTTEGGSASGRHGLSLTRGGFNSNLAAGKFSQADQQVLTLGGNAGRGKNLTFGGPSAAGAGSPPRGNSSPAAVSLRSRGQEAFGDKYAVVKSLHRV